MAIGPLVGSSPVVAPRPQLADDFEPDTAPAGAPQLGEWSDASSFEAEPAPTTSGPATVAPVATQATRDADKLTEMKDLMKQSPTGAAALKYMEDHHLPVKFANGGGSYWDGTSIVIDRSQSSQAAALTLVHEVNHAKASQTGISGDITHQTRADYVSTMLNEEVRGTVDSIKAKNELLGAGKSITATFPLEAAYNAAAKKATDELKAKKPDASAAELKAAGEKAGYDRVMEGFKTGEVVTSTNNTKYSDYYGGSWDRQHPTPPAVH
jgi:hypothetical protein